MVLPILGLSDSLLHLDHDIRDRDKASLELQGVPHRLLVDPRGAKLGLRHVVHVAQDW